MTKRMAEGQSKVTSIIILNKDDDSSFDFGYPEDNKKSLTPSRTSQKTSLFTFPKSTANVKVEESKAYPQSWFNRNQSGIFKRYFLNFSKLICPRQEIARDSQSDESARDIYRPKIIQPK